MDGKILGLAHVGLYVKDIERSLAFYKDILGFECYFRFVLDGEVPIAFIKNGTCEIEIIQTPKIDSRDDGIVDHIAFLVDDIEAVRAKLVEQGVKFDSGIIDHPECKENGSKWSFFRGPDNEHLEIVQVM